MRVIKFILMAFFTLIIFSGCSIKDGVKSGSDEEILRNRIMAFWHHKINDEFDKSYEYEDPFSRKTFTMVNYIRTFKAGGMAKWKDAEIEDIKIEGDTAEVALKVKIRIAASPSRTVEQEVPIKERWINVDGTWYHIYRKQGARQSN